MAVELTGSSTPSGRSTSATGCTSKSSVGTELAEQRDVALPVATEVEVLADHHGPGGQGVDEDLLHELAGRLLRAGLVEPEHDRGVQAGLGQELELGGQVGQQAGRRLGPHDAGRVPVEGDDDAPGSGVSGQTADLGDHGGMAQVHTVERADGDDRTAARPRRDAEVADDLHGRARYPFATSTTEGLAVPPSGPWGSYTARRSPSGPMTAHGAGPANAGRTRPWATRPAVAGSTSTRV